MSNTPQSELITLDAAAITDRHFGISREEIAAVCETANALTINGVDDKAGYEAVHKQRMQLKVTRTAIEARRKALKAGALEYGRKVDSVAKELTALVEPTEKALEAKQKAIDAEKERIKQQAAREAEEARQRLIQERLDKLSALDAKVDLVTLGRLTDEEFDELLLSEMDRYEKEQEAARIAEEERQRQEAEAAEVRRLEEERLAKERAELEAERKRQAEEAAERQRIEVERRKAEEARLAEERRQLEETQRIERERIAAERAELDAQRREIVERERKAREEQEARERAEREKQEEIARQLAEKHERERKESLAKSTTDENMERIALRNRIVGNVGEPTEFGLQELRLIDDLMFALKWSLETCELAIQQMQPVTAAVNEVRRENVDLFADAYGDVVDA